MYPSSPVSPSNERVGGRARWRTTSVTPGGCVATRVFQRSRDRPSGPTKLPLALPRVGRARGMCLAEIMVNHAGHALIQSRIGFRALRANSPPPPLPRQRWYARAGTRRVLSLGFHDASRRNIVARVGFPAAWPVSNSAQTGRGMRARNCELTKPLVRSVVRRP